MRNQLARCLPWAAARERLVNSTLEATLEDAGWQRLRGHRAVVNAVVDPLDKLLKGLSSMTHAQRLAEMETRQLPVPEHITHPAMILAIRDDVAMRTTLYATIQVN